MPWKQGQTGNPKGRPRKGRSLSELLLTMGGRRTAAGLLYRERAVAMLWELIDTGQVKLPDGRALAVSPQEWIRAISWMIGHMDGPARPMVAEGAGAAGELLDQVLSELDAGDLRDQGAITAGLGQFVLALLPLNRPELLVQAAELRSAFAVAPPSAGYILSLRKYFLADRANEVRTAARLFFGLPAVAAAIALAASEEAHE